MSSEFCLILCTCPTKEVARAIAHQALQQKLAACINIIDGVESIYLWQGQIEQEKECQMLIKSRRDKSDDLFKLVLSLHPYDVPEWVILPIDSLSVDYQQWLNASLD
ncbi:divalent cation tolerance protein CutA [Neptunicella marina]|uniref:Divalent-cation tolerance protein CutA n=1 Tax=Neptunicella marina TaxID=2125989 RepID=A0A8J6ISX4_9ALTE|nr:divalent-cation tolerance protein CutA [Neptunicella marina]